MKTLKTSLVFGLSCLMLGATLSLLPVGATCGGGGGGGDGGMSNGKVYTVPWKKLGNGETPSQATLEVYWFPATRSEFLTSDLRESRMLALYGMRCMVFNVVSQDSDRIQKFALDSTKFPAVVLASPDDTVINKVDSSASRVNVAQVETMVQSEMRKRSDELKARIDDAKTKADSGDKQAAIDAYKDVVGQKCLFPQAAKAAQKELKKLGVDEPSAMNIPDSPNADTTFGAKIEAVMAEGLKAENDSKYLEAEKYYQEAQRMDPNDPTPMRYLAELNRHHLGDWDKAAQLFHQILAMNPDPLSEAVALHGLGKMTIHNGEFKKGLGLMEQSVKVYPLAMAYRNLAVYWNSEGDSAKCDEYTRLALAADPTDPFNVVFSAVFLAGNGHTDEALKVAHEHEDLLPASYNLAAIYAQSGQKEKALELLKRHFYTYERNKSVRSKEMMEARVDRVFDSLIKDPAFMALTADADGKLPMRGMQDRTR